MNRLKSAKSKWSTVHKLLTECISQELCERYCAVRGAELSDLHAVCLVRAPLFTALK
jgi:hypothetical protein